ncbi:GtrA family protein [Pseudohongiella sp.]|uniref:GtrA/DPMS transmembrane domain-containing protein n=1 Tax=marine sediment metagenome TaxID=412755 RepID=A0A0F9YQK8_9ZZZZ|nr:GtrA family protein [Pseudohongiella sp.]HDZ10215.1 GtrA family protein [Pseudohongiella sp.]HEA63967.1 GtrA family protein [Pseudohongiella sp.]
MIQPFMSRQFIAFLLTGGTAALVNFITRIIYNNWMGFSSAVVLAYITGMVTAYILARIFVFKTSTQTLQRSMILFALVNLLAIIQTWAVSLMMAYAVLPALGVTQFTLEIAHAVGIVVPVFTSFLGHKYWSFR